MRVVKTKERVSYGPGNYDFGSLGASYRVQDTDITIEKYADRWHVHVAGTRVRSWDRLSWAKQHALEIASASKGIR